MFTRQGLQMGGCATAAFYCRICATHTPKGRNHTSALQGGKKRQGLRQGQGL